MEAGSLNGKIFYAERGAANYHRYCGGTCLFSEIGKYKPKPLILRANAGRLYLQKIKWEKECENNIVIVFL